MPRFRVFAASFMHETHSFSPVGADLESFKETGYFVGDEIREHFLHTRTEFGAVLDLADKYGWNLTHPLSAYTTPSGAVTRDAYEHISKVIIDGLRKAGKVDGIIIVLHGAMVAEHVSDAEAELLRRIREVVGYAVPLAVTLDLHANVGPDLAKHANIVSTFRTTPHIDMYETAERAGTLLQKTMLGAYKPKVVYAQRPMFYALDMGRTISGSGPMVEILWQADKILASNSNILDISINAGFDWSDKANIGSSVLITHDRQEPLAQAYANSLIEFAWETRKNKTVELLPIDEVVRIAREPAEATGPLLIGDFTDCPGGGAAGDGTVLLKAMIESGVQDVAFASIADPVAAKIGIEAGIGQEVQLELGGKIDPRFGGGPLAVTGKVIAVSDGVVVRKGAYSTGKVTSYGPSCVLEVGGVKIVVATNRVQIDDREQFRIFGIQPETTNVLVCKAVNHFRADYEGIGRRLIYAESGGIMSLNFAQFPFRNVRRPVWPLDDI